MKSTKRHFTLETGEYLITPDHPLAIEDTKIFIKGKDVTNKCVGLVMIEGYD